MKLSKIISIVAVSLILMSTVNAQKCKFDIDITDSFSGETQKGFKYFLFFKNHPNDLMNVFTLKNKGEYQIKLVISRAGIIDEEVSSDKHAFDIKLNNGEIISCKIDKNVVPNFKKAGTTEYTIIYKLTKAEMIQLSNSFPVAIKISAMPDKDLSGAVKEKIGSKMMSEAKCLLNL